MKEYEVKLTFVVTSTATRIVSVTAEDLDDAAEIAHFAAWKEGYFPSELRGGSIEEIVIDEIYEIEESA